MGHTHIFTPTMSDSEGDARAASKKERRQKKKKQQASADASADASAEANVDGGEIQMAVEPTVQTAVAPPLTVIEPDDGDAHLMKPRVAAMSGGLLASLACAVFLQVLGFGLLFTGAFWVCTAMPLACAFCGICATSVEDARKPPTGSGLPEDGSLTPSGKFALSFAVFSFLWYVVVAPILMWDGSTFGRYDDGYSTTFVAVLVIGSLLLLVLAPAVSFYVFCIKHKQRHHR